MYASWQTEDPAGTGLCPATIGRCAVIAALVMILIAVTALAAWLGFRAGYRRGWRARDQQER